MNFQKWEKTDVFVIVFLIERSAWSGSKRSIDMDRLVEIPKGLGSNFLFQWCVLKIFATPNFLH